MWSVVVLVNHDATDVLAAVHVVVALVDAIEGVGLGDQTVEIQLALGVQLEQAG